MISTQLTRSSLPSFTFDIVTPLSCGAERRAWRGSSKILVVGPKGLKGLKFRVSRSTRTGTFQVDGTWSKDTFETPAQWVEKLLHPKSPLGPNQMLCLSDQEPTLQASDLFPVLYLFGYNHDDDYGLR